MKKYIFAKYQKEYPSLFKREKSQLKKILNNSKIEHIGSTAVPGLGGKGIIDILISVSKKDDIKARKKLQKAGYEFKPKSGEKDRLFFKKSYTHKKKEGWIHVHLTSHNSKIWNKDILLRNYLRKNQKKLNQYEAIKRKAVKYSKNEGEKYRKYKNKFIKGLIKKTK